MFSILYEGAGEIFQIGPYPTEEEAMAAGREAQYDDDADPDDAAGSFDVRDQRVYLLTPEHRLQELDISDFLPEEANDGEEACEEDETAGD